jgi:hypothetical protein
MAQTFLAQSNDVTEAGPWENSPHYGNFTRFLSKHLSLS